MKPFRIGAGAGYSGDRIDPAQDLAERGELDALVFECLAERTIALAQLRRANDPKLGFDPLLRERMRAVLPACVRQGVTIITNMGAANPLAAGEAILQVGRDMKLARLRVAVVTGDDVLPWMLAHDAPLIDSGETVRSLDGRLISANAYLGADALLPALASGADVVVTGRVADPALFLAPLMHHFGWKADDWHRMGQGIVVGHLLECAAQVSGGYIADPGFVDVPRLHDVGFPLAEVQEDGSCVITKLAGTGGRVDRLTCTAQLLYELEDPARYLQPDVVADFSGVRLTDAGADRVAVEGATGRVATHASQGHAGLSRRLHRRGADLVCRPGRACPRPAGAGHPGRATQAAGPGYPGAPRRTDRRECDAWARAGHGPRALRSAGAPGAARTDACRGRTGGAGGGSALPQRARRRRRGDAVGARGRRRRIRDDPARGRPYGLPHPGALTMQVRDIALARSGDKGNRATLSVIARELKDYPLLERVLTAERVQSHYQGVVRGPCSATCCPNWARCTS